MGGERDLDLLRREMDLLWGPDAFGRPRPPHPLVALALADDGRDVRLAPSVPPDSRLPPTEDDPEAIRAAWRERLGIGTWRGGPSYVFDGAASAESEGLRVQTSEEAADPALVASRPDPWWEPGEWADLLAGRLGPWAIGTVGERIVTLCHTSAASADAAEAGVWTHPEARGRGWAAVATAAWARVAASRFETLFYSTAFENAASRAVARKLGLRPIGAIWQLRAEG